MKITTPPPIAAMFANLDKVSPQHTCSSVPLAVPSRVKRTTNSVKRTRARTSTSNQQL